MCRTRAESEGLPTSDFKEVERTEYEFVKTIELDFDTFSNVHNKPILSVDPDHKPENYNYIFTCPDSTQHKLANIYNGNVDVLGKVSETELRKQAVTPANNEQLFLSRAIQDTTIDVVLCEAKAGSGKTLVSLSNAMALINRNNPYESIIYIRASINDVDQVEEVGFLPGLEEKFAVYYHPIKDSIEYIARKKFSDSKLKGAELEAAIVEETERIIAKYRIQFMTGLGMRGRTFTNCIAIIDEVQGQSNASLQKMLTRFGTGCKVIIIGSQNQIDNKFVTKFNNGLSVLLDACAKPQTLIKTFAINLRKVVRSPLSEWAETIFTK
jgi:PhoH-like ATPase